MSEVLRFERRVTGGPGGERLHLGVTVYIDLPADAPELTEQQAALAAARIILDEYAHRFQGEVGIGDPVRLSDQWRGDDGE